MYPWVKTVITAVYNLSNGLPRLVISTQRTVGQGAVVMSLEKSVIELESRVR